MKYLLALRVLAQVPLALSWQEGTSPPPADVTIRDLEFGDINFLHTTDTHGWHAGHLKQGSYGGDWGDYVTFANILRDKLEAQGKDLLIVDTGDRIRGNGLYGADPVPGTWTNRIFKQQALHALTTGNHELYFPETTYFEHDKVVPEYPNKYLVGNLEVKTPAGDVDPFSPFWVKTTTMKASRLNVTTMGLIHDLAVIAQQNPVAHVTPVQTVVEQQRFKDAITNPYVDVFVVIGHVPVRPDTSPWDRYRKRGWTETEFKVVLDAIRNCNCSNSNKPVQFFGGDYHIRDYRKYDNRSAALASGMYFETIGFASINGLKVNGGKGDLKFSRRYIDNNLLSFMHHTGKYGFAFQSEQGFKVSNLITEARTNLSLDVVQGCTPRNLWLSHVPVGHKNNLYTWISKEVFVNGAGPQDRAKKPRLMYMNSGSIRYDIYQGEFTVDTAWSICPFGSPLVYIADVPYEKARLIPGKIGLLSVDEHTDDFDLDMFKPAHLRHLRENCPRFGNGFAASQIPLSSSDPPKVELPLGYVTKDDLGNDGDDTVHDPFLNCPVPGIISGVNFDESKPPATVDVVFNEYLTAKTLGQLQGYKAEDVKPYGPKKGEKQELRDFLLDWVKANWKKGSGPNPCS